PWGLTSWWFSRPSLFALFGFRLGLLRGGLVRSLGFRLRLRSGRRLGGGLRGLLLGRFLLTCLGRLGLSGLDFGLLRGLGGTRLRLLRGLGRLVDDCDAVGALGEDELHAREV